MSYESRCKRKRPKIECVEVLKVYDNCWDVVEFNESDPVPSTCQPLPTNYSIGCALSNVQCTGPVSIQPHGTGDNMANVWFRVSWDKTITITDTDTGAVVCTINTHHSIPEIVSLYAPPGFDMIYQCMVLSYTCNACTTAVIDGTLMVLCEVEFCLDIQTKYPVKLRVWTSGECKPGPCDPKQVPDELELVCPTYPLYPPQPPKPCMDDDDDDMDEDDDEDDDEE